MINHPPQVNYLAVQLHVHRVQVPPPTTEPMHPICQQTLMANFTNSEAQRYGTDVEILLANPKVRKSVDWVANKDPEFDATTAKKQR